MYPPIRIPMYPDPYPLIPIPIANDRLESGRRGSEKHNAIVVSKVKVMQPRASHPDEFSRFNEEHTSDSLTVIKRIHTPQATEVNKIRRALLKRPLFAL